MPQIEALAVFFEALRSFTIASFARGCERELLRKLGLRIHITSLKLAVVDRHQIIVIGLVIVVVILVPRISAEPLRRAGGLLLLEYYVFDLLHPELIVFVFVAAFDALAKLRAQLLLPKALAVQFEAPGFHAIASHVFVFGLVLELCVREHIFHLRVLDLLLRKLLLFLLLFVLLHFLLLLADVKLEGRKLKGAISGVIISWVVVQLVGVRFPDILDQN